MERQRILRRLLSLSRYHHSLVVEEKWDQWESVADQKEQLVRCLEMGGLAVSDEQERLLLTGIARWDRRTADALHKKKQETGDRLSRVNRARLALKDYGKANRGDAGPHFGIKC